MSKAEIASIIDTLLQYGEKDPITQTGVVKVPLPAKEYHQIVRNPDFVKEFCNLHPLKKSRAIRGMFLWEESGEGWGLGSASQLYRFLEFFRKDVERAQRSKSSAAYQLRRTYERIVTEMLFARKNPYIPFGNSVPENIRSYDDYELWRKVRGIKQEEKAHRDKLVALEKQKERLIQDTERKKKNALRSIEREEINNMMIKYEEEGKTALMVREIVNRDHPINFYPEWVAEKLANEPEVLKKHRKILLSKLEYAKRGSKWKKLSRKLQ